MSKKKEEKEKKDVPPPVDPATIKTAGVVEKMLQTERAVPSVAPPNWEALPHNKVFDAKNVPIMKT